VKPFGVYTIFPHPNHNTLDSLFSRLKEKNTAPKLLLLLDDTHKVEDNYEYQKKLNNSLTIL